MAIEDVIQAAKELLEWVPVCSPGSSGYIRTENLKAAIQAYAASAPQSDDLKVIASACGLLPEETGGTVPISAIIAQVNYWRNRAASAPEQTPTLRTAIFQMMEHRQWSTDWIHRSAYLHLESAELAEAVRGKRGETLDESADVLITLLALSPHELRDIERAAAAKVATLMTKPRYAGETGKFGDVPTGAAASSQSAATLPPDLYVRLRELHDPILGERVPDGAPAPEAPPAIEVYSRPECQFNYCDTKAPHTECLKGCHHATEPSGGVDSTMGNNCPDAIGDGSETTAQDYRSCSKCSTRWTGDVKVCPTCEAEGICDFWDDPHMQDESCENWKPILAPAALSEQEERANFEKFAAKWMLDRYEQGTGKYISGATQIAWEGWLARAQQGKR